jgi:ATP-binding cassette, subfamily F, member 3
MISVNQVAVQFGGFELFSGISFQINQRDRIGLVGKNGAGKTTLLKLIKGLNSPDKGEIVIPEDIQYRISSPADGTQGMKKPF